MSKKSPTTPRSQVRAALRQCWLRSRERAAAEKRDNHTCQVCGKKKSAAKGREVAIEIHHLDGVEWNKILDYIYRHLLVHPDKMITLCKECHSETHETNTI